MRSETSNLALLVDEYQTLATETGTVDNECLHERDLKKVKKWLVTHGDWTPHAAGELVDLS